VAKTYLALVTGPALDAAEGEIDAPLARYRQKPELELMRAARPGDAAQSALTRWRVLASAGTTHLVELAPRTGRMHQLRVHLSIIGRPILGDPYYGGQTTLRGEPIPRLMLHAWKLDLPHPSGERLTLKARTPKDFLAVASVAGLDLALTPD
jgi:tRNA pseudouridine32 synthase/23S rRNA pseudouridine746 synthase